MHCTRLGTPPIETDMTSIIYDVNVVFAPFPCTASLLRVDAIGPVRP